ncbi:MAG: hypothetical protein ACUVQ8_00205 [Nitrososphaeria archaeon]
MAFDMYMMAKIALEVVALAVTIVALFVSYKGYLGTKRSVFARLSLAFVGLSINFLLLFFADVLAAYGYESISPYFRLGSSFFEMLGFFFLAFSHMVKAYQEQKLATLSFVVFNPAAAFKVLSLYFIFYAALETVISYFKLRSRVVLVIAIGLTGFAIQSVLSWLSEFVYYPIYYQIFSLVFQIVGVAAFSIPIWIYYRGAKS